MFFAGIAAIGLINEALDEGDPMKTLAMLQNPSAKLTDVDPSVAQHYHDKLLEARREKAHVRHTHVYPGSCSNVLVFSIVISFLMCV